MFELHSKAGASQTDRPRQSALQLPLDPTDAMMGDDEQLEARAATAQNMDDEVPF